MYPRYSSKIKSLIHGDSVRKPATGSLPPLYRNFSKLPKSFNSFTVSRSSLVRDFISDQFERFRYKEEHPRDNGQDVLLEWFAKLQFEADFADDLSTVRKQKIRPSCWVNEQRYVVMSDFPADASLADLLSRVRGGKLERVVLGKHPEPYLELYFLDYKSANAFSRFAASGLFIINGKKPLIGRKVPEKRVEPVQDLVRVAAERMNASRVLRLQSPVEVPAISSKAQERFPRPRQWFVKTFDMEDIRKDLSQYGTIVEIKPIISQGIAVSVHFTSISELLLALRSLGIYDSLHWHKYKEWSISFSPDPADTPCFSV